MLRSLAVALALLLVACGMSTSHTRTGTGMFAPREDAADEDEDKVPIGLTLSIASIQKDGTVTLDLRNYSIEPFTFAGTPERPRLIVEVRSGNTHSKHTLSPFVRSHTYDVPAGEKIQLTTNVAGASGRIRIGIRSHDFGYTVWTSWFAL